MNWVIKYKRKPKDQREVIKILLKNRGLIEKKDVVDFFSPKNPKEIALKEVGLKGQDVRVCVTRIKKALKNKEKVIIYGDYDADGICATAILWETLYKLGLDCLPHIPERFSEGYGLNEDSIKALKEKHKNLRLIITVDNGITAHKAVSYAKKQGIDVIVTDHHQKSKNAPNTKYILHTTQIGGAGLSWFFAREIKKNFSKNFKKPLSMLELSAIGTISDLIPLLGVNRSIVKKGLKSLTNTKRKGLLSLYKNAGMEKERLGIYDVNFIIAPRINAMGRLESGMDSLRLLCTTNIKKADELSKKLSKVNTQRQKIVEEVVAQTKTKVRKKDSLIIVAGEYHEGVIGLAASKLVEENWKPSIVISKESKISKASARSIPGFNIIKAIRKFDNLIEGGGGHPMAAGFSIKTANIEKFKTKINAYASKKLTEDVLKKSMRVDMEIEFDLINKNFYKILKKFEPAGIGNPGPVFVTRNVDVLDVRTVGKKNSHLKLKLAKTPHIFDAIGFGMGKMGGNLKKKDKVDVVYQVDENVWNGRVNLQLKLKDLSVNSF